MLQGSAEADVNEDRALMRFEFIEALLRVAITMRNTSENDDPSPAEKVRPFYHLGTTALHTPYISPIFDVPCFILLRVPLSLKPIQIHRFICRFFPQVGNRFTSTVRFKKNLYLLPLRRCTHHVKKTLRSIQRASKLYFHQAHDQEC